MLFQNFRNHGYKTLSKLNGSTMSYKYDCEKQDDSNISIGGILNWKTGDNLSIWKPDLIEWSEVAYETRRIVYIYINKSY